MNHWIWIALFAAAPASAGEVYKCKGPNGEVTFTNIKCPEKTTAQHYSSYTPAQDSPDHYFAAAEAVRAAEARGDQAPAQMPDNRSVAAKARMDARSDRRSIETEDPRTSLGNMARAERLREQYGLSQERSDSEQTGDQSALSETQLGNPPTVTTSCKQNGSNVTCARSDGTFAHGNVDPFGNGDIRGADGTPTRIKTDPFGQKSVDGICVRDIYGQCQ